jgi:predicted DNA-binding protein
MPKEKYNDTQINIRLPEELYRQGRAKAKREKRPFAEVVRDLIRAWLADKPTASA